MSNQPTGGSVPPGPRSASNGSSAGGSGISQQPNAATSGAVATGGQGGIASPQNLNSIDVGSPSIIQSVPRWDTASENFFAAAEALRSAANSYRVMEVISVPQGENGKRSEIDSESSSKTPAGAESLGQTPQQYSDNMASSSQPQSLYESSNESSQPSTPARNKVVSESISGRDADSHVSTPNKQARKVSEETLTSEELMQKVVIEYLSKKGYSRTEAMLRLESANQDSEGRPIHSRIEDSGGPMYVRAFDLIRDWIEESIDIYKPELRRLLWPLFVYSFLQLAADFYPRDSEIFFNAYKDLFAAEHEDDLRALGPISLPEHINDNEIAQIYRSNKYRLTLSNVAYFNLIQYLETKDTEGGATLIRILKNCHIVTVNRGATTEGPNSLAALLKRGNDDQDMPAEDEGISGHSTGSTDRIAPATLVKLKLGPLPMDPELMEDVQAELEEEDSRNPPRGGESSLMQEFDRHIKREESEEAPTRNELPLPPSLSRDVAMEVQKLKENRERFRIEGKTGGVGPGVSVCMYTFHNTYDTINCLDFSEDNELVAAGTSESYIRVWNLEGKPLSLIEPPSASRRLIGHSGPVYAVSFSPSIANRKRTPSGPSTGPKCLLSCSADKAVRLWSLETWSCLVVYKGHDHPVWDVKWGPFGHYFLTGSHDKTARLWSTDHISALRIFAGHDQDVDAVCFHPNNCYVFTGSCDKKVQMWAVQTGSSVRMFIGHTANITSLACSPDGKTLASADDAGAIILWDLRSGRRVKRMRGHGKGGIWSVSWSVESTVLVSGGADGTVRVWDVAPPLDTQAGQGKVIGEGGAGVKIGDAGPSVGQRKGRENVVTPDQISAFPTKKSPVYRATFTRQNLVVAGGAYLP